MAQFRATIQGQRGEASRLGSKGSGLRVECNGWNGGVRVDAEYHEASGGDCFNVYATSGSSYAGKSKFLGYVDSKGEWHKAESDAQLIADVFAAHSKRYGGRTSAVADELAHDIADELDATAHNFERAVFLAACGVTL